MMRGWLQMPGMLLGRAYRILWLRVGAYALVSVLLAIGAAVVDGWIPLGVAALVQADDVIPILTILASSLLAVSTFSLNVMVAAHRAAADISTPRIHRLLLEDTTTQSVLAIFIGAFVSTLTMLILFRMGAYSERASILVMAVAILIVALIIGALLRWIEHLSRLGSLDDSMRRVERPARTGLSRLARRPALGATPLVPGTVLPTDLRDVPAPRSGYVQLVDIAGLEEYLDGESRAYVRIAPGEHVLAGQPLVQVSGRVTDAAAGRIAASFVIGDIRTFEQDPAIGLVALSEIASKALSPGINDTGTAIEAIARSERLLWDYARARADAGPAPPRHDRVFLPVPPGSALIEAAFGTVARDGAGQIEVAQRLRAALLTLGDGPDPELATAALRLAERALRHADQALPLEEERDALRATGTDR